MLLVARSNFHIRRNQKRRKNFDANLVGSGLGWTDLWRLWTYFWAFLLLFLFFNPNVLSSTIFASLLSQLSIVASEAYSITALKATQQPTTSKLYLSLLLGLYYARRWSTIDQLMLVHSLILGFFGPYYYRRTIEVKACLGGAAHIYYFQFIQWHYSSSLFRLPCELD